MIIQPHPDSTTDLMIHIMDSARQAGVYNVSPGVELTRREAV